MKYLNTNFELFLENKNSVHKYEIVEFLEDYTFNLYAGEDTDIELTVKKGDKAKVYFDKSKSSDTQYNIIGIRPLNLNESKVELKDLWEANFLFEEPIIMDKNNVPFKIESYL
jgi:hypothetical protein